MSNAVPANPPAPPGERKLDPGKILPDAPQDRATPPPTPDKPKDDAAPGGAVKERKPATQP